MPKHRSARTPPTGKGSAPRERSPARPSPPCRLHVYLAGDAPLAVILRRGPSDWTRLSLWHTDTDRFEHGQWLHARVYERRFDLSPDGALFAAFIRGGATPARPADSWLAISRPPYFTALALWWVGGTYCAGAYFTGPRSLWLATREPPDQGTLPPGFTLEAELPTIIRTPDWTERLVHANRLLRDGWQPTPGLDAPQPTWEREQGGQTLLISELPRHDTGGSTSLECALITAGDLHPLGRATWAGWDQHGRLILARAGKLVHVLPNREERLILDFNDQEPASIPPSNPALHWPPPLRRKPR